MHKAPITLTEGIIGLILFITLMGLHFSYTPWLFASEPIEALEYYELENEPAPIWAKSFAINHGRAIYYHDIAAINHPAKRITIIVSILALWSSLLGIMYRAHKRSKHDS